ncbi:MAG TPA: type II secretion system protein [Patescibacteria group bacterium]|nr:type II secretion system protein [Patescibacteria group bacterium]
MLRCTKHEATEKAGEQKGFTIVELMVALSILSTLLVMSTVILIQIGKLYTKGVNEAATQNAARDIINDLSSQLQLSGNAPDNDTPGVKCIGNQRYTFNLNHKLVTPPATGNYVIHVLWRDTIGDNGPCVPVDLTQATPGDTHTLPNSGVEMVPLNARLTDFSITPNQNNTYAIRVTVAYGDDDLVQFDSTHDITTCSSGVGTEFCAVSSLNITVARRLVQ